MKIYTDVNYNIISLDKEPDSYYKVIDTADTRESLFNGLCDEAISLMRYEPLYTEHVMTGYILSSSVDWHVVQLIQNLYSNTKKEVFNLSARLDYWDMVSEREDINNE
ncbi:hypothetical protein LXJ15735_11540 [Lacrimispora xylanolytica]